MPLDVAAVRGILPRGGTILGSRRTNPYEGRRRAEPSRLHLAELGVDALIAIGGEDTLGVATRLHDDGVQVVGVPKTIDNDLGATDYTFGFDTAVTIATEAIDRLHTTAECHHRALICEVMGRHAGWIALHSGIAGGANVILIPERPFDIDRVCDYVERRFATRSTHRSSSSPRARCRSEGTMDPRGRSRRLRPRAAVRHRRTGWRRRSRPHRARGAGDGARPRAARRHAHGVRPGARDPLRPARDRRGARRATGADGRPARHRDRPGAARGGDRASSRPCRRSCMPRPRSSSADGGG